MSVCSAAIALLVVGAGNALAVATAAELCQLSADPCVVSRNFRVDDGTVLDLGGRTLELAGDGRLDVERGSMTIVARSLRLRTGARLLGRGGHIVVTTSEGIELADQTRIDVSETNAQGDQPGSIRLEAGGEIRVEGLLNAGAVQRNDGGGIEIAGAAVTLAASSRVDVSGGPQSIGGVVVIIAQNAFNGLGPISANGGDSGGSIEIDAGSVTTGDRLDVSGGANGGGALVDISSRGSVVVNGIISGEVGSPSPVFGTAAEVSILAVGAVELNEGIILTGGPPGGEGGTLEVESDATIIQRGAISVASRGTDSAGGEVRMTSIGNMTVADIDAGGPSAGTIFVASAAAIALKGTLAADASLELLGTGGTIDVAACTLDMETTATLSSVGVAGINRVRSGGQMVLRGIILAGDTNILEFEESTVQPQVSAQITPPATPQLNEGLGLCEGIPGGGGSTTTLPGNCGTLADFAGLLCRLTALQSVANQASVEALGGKRTAKKLKKKISRAIKLVESAQGAKKKKQAKKLKAAGRQLVALQKALRKAKKIDPTVGATLKGLGEAAQVQLNQLRSSS